MPEHTTTIWTCSRCGDVEEVEGIGQPKDWCRVGFVTPPKASWSDKLQTLGDLCNGDMCGGLIVAFIQGTEDVEKPRLIHIAEAIERATSHPSPSDTPDADQSRPFGPDSTS